MQIHVTEEAVMITDLSEEDRQFLEGLIRRAANPSRRQERREQPEERSPQGDRDRQREASRAGTARVDEVDAVTFADRRFDEASTGTKQRMALAKALINDPQVLLLDEPTVGLDPDIARRVREYIREFHRQTRCTLILTTHYMPEAQMLCERIAFIREGKILALGTPDQLKAQVNAKDMEGVFLELAR